MLRLLFDENLNQRIVRGLRRRVPSLDDVVAHDLKTIPRFAYERVSRHETMPGVIAVVIRNNFILLRDTFRIMRR